VPLATGSDEMQRGARWRSCPVRLWKKGCEEEKEAMAGAQSPFEAGASVRAAGEGGVRLGFAAWRRGKRGAGTTRSRAAVADRRQDAGMVEVVPSQRGTGEGVRCRQVGP
jgi:hypothetical protein